MPLSGNEAQCLITYHLMYWYLSTVWYLQEDTKNFHDLSEELKAKARSCTTPEEMLALAKDAGFELSDSEIEAVSGGGNWCFDDCSENRSPLFP